MAMGTSNAVLGHFQVLFNVGAIGSLSDEQLLERFAAGGGGGEAAFEALLARHGPMVLGVCRRVLGDPHDVQDAFQATFLVLVRKADSLRDRDLLANWLYGVACRIAVKARAEATRRKARERHAAELAAAVVPVRDRDDWRSWLDEEIRRLPSKFREPLVLCHLQGMRHEDAAQHLGCPVGTIESRLSRARERLRDRLMTRGFVPATGLLLAALAPDTASAATLAGPALAIAMRARAGIAAAGAIPTAVTALAESALKSMVVAKLSVVGASVVAVGLVAAGVGTLASREARPHAAGDNPPQTVTVDPGITNVHGALGHNDVTTPRDQPIETTPPDSAADSGNTSAVPSNELPGVPSDDPIPVVSPIIEAPFRTGSPQADGVISPEEYGPPVDVSFVGDDNPGRIRSPDSSRRLAGISRPRAKGRADLSYRLYAAHTTTSLFLAFAVRDQEIDAQPADKTSPQNNDSVEVFLDGDRVPNDFNPANNRGSREGFQLVSDVLGNKLTVATGFSNKDWKVGTRRTSDGYVVEFEIPLDLIDTADGPGFAPAQTGSVLRFNAAVTDNDEPVSKQNDYSVLWSDATPTATSPFFSGEQTWAVGLRLTPP
ncbi:MAG TPA: sigma-70 family RNA polymerase sigma factor [Isosphaeraceae bacterium]|jgi:RNA polymerase sigma factor (sigma-70 family)|nr:sigma-70 family RNA polymerase sigma factor [Isosphaeraceae bacterium]